MPNELLNFYRSQSPFTQSKLLQVPADWGVDRLAAIAQNQLLHYGWAGQYQAAAGPEKLQQINTRTIDRLLQQNQAAGHQLTDTVAPAERHLGCCRDFSLLTTAMLRTQGIPARNRIGFAAYFTAGHWHDHVITEWWDGSRWVWTDAQLDDFQQDAVKLPFDPLDMPQDEQVFMTAARAWLAYRAGRVDPWTFAVFPGSPIGGPGFIRGNLLHELYSLNKRELLLWEGPQEFWRDVEDLSDPELQEMDRLAHDLVSSSDDLDLLQRWMERFDFQQVTCRAPNGFEEQWNFQALPGLEETPSGLLL